MKLLTKTQLTNTNFFEYFFLKHSEIKEFNNSKRDFLDEADQEILTPREFQNFLNVSGKRALAKFHVAFEEVDEHPSVKPALATLRLDFETFKQKFLDSLALQKANEKDKLYVTVFSLADGSIDVKISHLDFTNKLLKTFTKTATIHNHRKLRRRRRRLSKIIIRSKFLHITEAIQLFLICGGNSELIVSNKINFFFSFLRTLRLFIVR